MVVLHVYNMGYKQGLENVIAAAELARRTNSRARFVLLGDGNQRASLQAATPPTSALSSSCLRSARKSSQLPWGPQTCYW